MALELSSKLAAKRPARIFNSYDLEEHDQRWADAVNLFSSGDKTGALFRFKRLADEGCSPALVEIANIYEHGGSDLKKDISEAIFWYESSIETIGDPKAYLGLVRIYLKYAKNDKEFSIAYEYAKVLENEGEIGAIYALGYLYETGRGIEKDLKIAKKYYLKAANNGHLLSALRKAKLSLSDNYIKGLPEYISYIFRVFFLALTNPTDWRLGIK